MVTLATSSSERRTKHSVIQTTNSLAEDKRHFSLAYALQTSLELNKTLEIFFHQIQDFVVTSAMDYSFDAQNISVAFGKQGIHSVSYNLASEDTNLGSIAFSRSNRFSETELSALEMLIGVLFLPLRNSLLYREAIQSSLCDALTGIGNRKALNLSFDRELKLAKRHDQPLSVLLIDVDHFKAVNDSVGHSNGDKTLKQIVKTIQNTLRETDQVFRYGGEEFLALLNNTGPVDAKIIADRIRLNVAMSPISLEDQNLFCTISIGISTFDGFASPDTLIEQADSALYKSKEGGRNRVELWSDKKQKTA